MRPGDAGPIPIGGQRRARAPQGPKPSAELNPIGLRPVISLINFATDTAAIVVRDDPAGIANHLPSKKHGRTKLTGKSNEQNC